MNMKKVLSILLAVLMLIPVVPLSVNAETYSGACGAQGDNVTWEIDVNSGTLFINGTGDMADYDTASAAPWSEYSFFPGFSYISIGEGVTSIGNNAFRSGYVSTIALSSTVKKLGFFPFGSKNIIIDENNPYLEMDDYGVIYSEDGKRLIYASKYIYDLYTVPDGVEEFAPYAFCSFVTDGIPWLYVPASVKNIPANAFFTISDNNGFRPASIPYFWVDDNNPYYSSDEYGVLFDKNKEVLYMTPHLEFSTYNLYLTNYIIPDTVKELADYSFYGYEDESILITDNVTKIGAYAFYASIPGEHSINAYRLYIPKSVTSLADDFFVDKNCTNDYNRGIKKIYYEGTQEEWETLYSGTNDYLTVYYEHSHTNTIIEENCTQKIYTCSGCLTVTIIEDIGDNHDWEWTGNVIEPDCEAIITKDYYCTKCFARKSEDIAPVGHDWYTNDNISSCAGGTATYYCYNCDSTKEEYIEPTEEHSWIGLHTDAIYCAGGIVHWWCECCPATKDEYIEPKGHLYQFVYDNNATCTEDGTKHEYCPRCGSIGETITLEGSKLGHDLTEATVLSVQTCSQDGISVQACKRCSEITAITESAYGHYDNDKDGKCDDCTCLLERTEDNAPEEPEEPQKSNSILTSIIEFFNKIINIFKNLFKI